MAYALVGSTGAASQGASGASVTPAWGTGENRTANNLLVCWVAGTGSATLPSAPVGWSVAKQVAGTSCSASIFYKIAAGSDVAPTVAAVTGAVLSAQLAEYSGNNTSSPLDQTGSATGTTSPQIATAGTFDAKVGELVLGASAVFYSRNVANVSGASTLNNGATATDTQNNSTSAPDHFDFTYGITTGNVFADSDSYAFTATHITGVAVVLASFLLPSVTTPQSLSVTETTVPSLVTSKVKNVVLSLVETTIATVTPFAHFVAYKIRALYQAVQRAANW